MGVESDENGVQWEELSVSKRDCLFFYYHNLNAEHLPKLMFLHGGGSNGAKCIPLFSPLASNFHIFLPSARGHGKSVPTDDSHGGTLEAVEDAAEIIQHIGGPVFLVGHSMGATVACRVAKFYPELVKGVVLEDPAWFVEEGVTLLEHPDVDFGGPPPGPQPTYPFQEENEKASGGRGGGRGHGHGRGRGRGERGRGGEGMGGEGRGEGRGGGRGGRGGRGGPGKGLGDNVSNQSVTGIPVPVLIFTGGPAAHCDKEVLAKAMKTYPHGQEYNFPEAGHAIHGWYPDEWRAQVKKFFESL